MRIILNLLPLFIILAIYSRWFFSSEIIGGDWPYRPAESLFGFVFPVPSWDIHQGNGLGGLIQSYALQSYFNLTIDLFVNKLNISWEIVYKIFWFGLFNFLSVFSMSYLFKELFPKVSSLLRILSIILFCANTYILMIAEGGQLGIILAYSCTPLVVAQFIQQFKEKELNSSYLKRVILTSISLTMQIIFDARIAFISLLVIVTYIAFSIFLKKDFKRYTLHVIGVIFLNGLLSLLLNMFWILPLLLLKYNPVESGGISLTSIEAFRFFSFAKLENTIGLLHPNWPENIFGKTYFMKPEFLILPIIAFLALFFVFGSRTKIINKHILFFSIIGLIGIFLAKGYNPPFEQINIFLFQYIPGFQVFRDSTKWYVLIALSFAILIPYSTYMVGEKIVPKSKKHVKTIFYITIIIGYLLLINPIFINTFNNTFKEQNVPSEYKMLNKKTNNERDFYRIVWLPQQSFFAYDSRHPNIEGRSLLKTRNIDELITVMKKDQTRDLFEDLSVKYVIIPSDPTRKIFVKNNEFDSYSLQKLVKSLENSHWLQEVPSYGKLTIFKMRNYKGHLYLSNGSHLSYEMISPVKYSVELNTNINDNLIFSENYHPAWELQIGGKIIKSRKTSENLNLFSLDKSYHNRAILYFKGENYYMLGRAITVTTFMCMILFLVQGKFINIFTVYERRKK